MSLTKKTLILIISTLAALIIVLYITISLIFIRSFAALEEADVLRDCSLLTNSINNELDQLNIKAGDWAVWDDTYEFIENRNESYIRSNLTENSLALLKINFMFFVNSDGKIIYSIGYDIKNNKKIQPPMDIAAHIIKGKPLVEHKSSDSYNIGIIKLGNQPTMISSRPIVDSLAKGPARGTLVWGVFLDEIQISKISQLTRLNISMKNYNEPVLPGDFIRAREGITDDNPVFVMPIDSKIVAGYILIRDIYGKPISLVQVKINRDVYRQGLAARRYLVASIVIVGLVFGGLIVFLMEKLVLRRLTVLSKGVFGIGKNANPSQRLEVAGDDELAALTISLNTMLESLEISQQSILQTDERLAVTLRSIDDGVISTDIYGNVVLMNIVAEELTGYKQEDALGKPLCDFFKMIDERKGIPCGDLPESVISCGTKISYGEQTILMNRDGSKKIIAVSGAPIFDTENKAIGVIIVFRDMSESLKIQEELLRAQKLESIQNLAGGIAHDFNNILMGIIANISLLKVRIEPDTESIEIINDTEAACFRAKGLTHQLLTFSKGGAPVKTNSSIAEILRESAGFSLSGSNVKCEINLPDDLWSVEIDEGQIHQVINNLIINAQQAMPSGGIVEISAKNVTVEENYQLSGRTYPHIQHGKYVRVKFKDHGMGIPNEIFSRIFDPYFTTKPQGNGLGLSIVYSIIKKHEGFLDLESEVDKGTVFYIYLPSSGEVKSSKRKDEKIPVTGKGRVLIMDDDESILKSVGKMVTHLGYEVVCAREGDTAIKFYAEAMNKEFPFNIVIMDLTIPGGMGGKETILRLLEIDPAVKAVVSSGYSNDPIMSDYKKYGFSGVITKPYSTEYLAELLNSLTS